MHIFIAHCSDFLTDYRAHGDGLVAYGFIHGLAQRGHVLHVAIQASEIRGPLPSNIRLYPIKTRHRKGKWQRLEYMLGIRRLLRELRREHPIEIIHQLNPVFTGLSLALIGSRLPIVLGPYVGKWPEEVRRFGTKMTFKRKLVLKSRAALVFLQQAFADAYLIATPNALGQIARPEQWASRVRVLPHGIDPQSFVPAEEWDAPETFLAEQKSPSILFYAHIWYGKGLDTLIEAFDEVAEAIPNVRLVVAGDGADLPPARERVAALAHGAQVSFLGMWQRDKAIELFHTTSVYCLPSRGEPFGMTALEAMSCAKPLVVTAAGGLQYLVEERGGRVVPVDDPRELAAALIELLRDPELRLSMAKFNRELVMNTYRWEKLAEALERIYLETIQGRTSSTPPKIEPAR